MLKPIKQTTKKDLPILRAQPGFQEKFLASPADIVIGGGAAGAGKSFALLLEPLRFRNIRGAEGVIFRSSIKELEKPGSIWREAQKLYHSFSSVNLSRREFKFNGGATIKFDFVVDQNLENEAGSQYAFIGFDELHLFKEQQFDFLLKRLRTGVDGIKPYMRCTCNPLPDSWLSRLIDWWIDDDGFPIAERSGIIRYFVTIEGEKVWSNSIEELVEEYPDYFKLMEENSGGTTKPEHLVKSLTFIGGSVYENKALLARQPEYIGNLEGDPEIRSRLLEGNWKYKNTDSVLIKYEAINNIFTLKEQRNKERGISCDVARDGKDTAVICVWEGFNIIHMEIYSTSKLDVLYGHIERLRQHYKVLPHLVVIDEGGVGAGVVDFSKGRYLGFVANRSPLKNYIEPAEVYKTLKDQCSFYIVDIINRDMLGIDVNNIFMDGRKTMYMTKGKLRQNIRDFIIAELTVQKRSSSIYDSKKTIINKKDIKEAIGRSPDIWDSLVLRAYTIFNYHKIDYRY